MSPSSASTSNQTTVSTTSVADSYNQAFSRVENLSNVGNVSILTDQTGGTSLPLPILIILILGGLAVLFIFKRKV